MEAICARGDTLCDAYALTVALHALHLYCATISAGLICCCTPVHQQYRYNKSWRGQNVRGVAGLLLFIVWCCGAGAACLRVENSVQLTAGLVAPLAWIAATTFHIVLWNRRCAAPILYLAIYWFLVAIANAAIVWNHFTTGVSTNHVQIYIESFSIFLALILSGMDCICFYDEVTKRFGFNPKSSKETCRVTYKHNDAHFYSKILFYWLNPLMIKGYESPLEQSDLGELPEDELSMKSYLEFKSIYTEQKDVKKTKRKPSIWQCYIRKVWPNFYIAGVLKLFSDLIGVVPPLGLAAIIQFISEHTHTNEADVHVTVQEFFNNGYIMLVIVTLALISQAFLSQNSTHLVTVEGTRLKTALQAMVYDKCMRLAPWSSADCSADEDTPLLPSREDHATSPAGLLTNLVSQDTYNIMSCVWICHYIWAIPLKIAVILYLLYTKLGISALIGSGVSVMLITPLQFYIGKKLSDNSKEISKCTDHRISKMAEILHGMNVIKLYVWEDVFKEKILQLREVELKFLNKDSIYWSFLTFTTQISSILITVITFITLYYLEGSSHMTAVNVFTGLALFNQLTVPLLILPVTVLMVIQSMVSTKRIKDFLDLPESNNVREDDDYATKPSGLTNAYFFNHIPEDPDETNKEAPRVEYDDIDQFSDDESISPYKNEYLVTCRNAAFTWGMKNDMLLEVDDLDIPAGKLIMVVGATGSGKSSLLSAVLGEMYLERGDISFNGSCSTWYAGQPPWLLEGSVRDNIVMDNSWSPQRYARVLRATGLRPDLQILPEGDATKLGAHGSPLSGGQRVRVCVARALYSSARLVALDEPLGALDAALARHVVARGLVPAARSGRTILVATNRLELLHYADLIIAMEEGRISGFGPVTDSDEVLSRWLRLAAEARAAAARLGAGPPGGSARERNHLVRALSRTRFHKSNDAPVGINEATGSHLLAEVATCAGGTWRRATVRQRPVLARQLSSPPPSMYNKWQREVRRTVSADEADKTLQREVSLLRRLLRPNTRHQRTLNRWTPRSLRRLISSDSDQTHDEQAEAASNETSTIDTPFNSITSNGGEVKGNVSNETNSTHKDVGDEDSEFKIWWEYARACGWCGLAYFIAAVTAQALAVAADCWLSYATADKNNPTVTTEQMWKVVSIYGACSLCGACAAGAAQAWGAGAGARARRRLHDRLLHAALHAPLQYYNGAYGHMLHRFSADIQLIDKKLPTAIGRWAQLAFMCTAAMLVNAVAAPWSMLALLPAIVAYFGLQSIYLCNARELQRVEAKSAASVVSLCTETCAGGGTVRAARLQARMRACFMRRLDANHNALLLLNAANRWLGLSLDLVGALSVCVSLGVAAAAGSGSVAGLAGAYALMLPAYLAHLAKGRADLDAHLAALDRVHVDTNMPQEDYREDCSIPEGWQRDGKIDFENVTIKYDSSSPPILNNVHLSIAPGEKVAICGRSGSGKSSLALAAAGAALGAGRVLLDGHDITHVPLRALRHRVLVLPQDPVLFSGTLRENLDPLAVHTDDEIWHCLRAVGLYDFVTTQSAGLECTAALRGGWSVGRAARACSARAGLHARRAALLVLDEPGAALDAPAERALLAAMAALAPHATILTIAHRVSSVRNYERAIVLEGGRVVETGAVSTLLAQPSSRLARMMQQAHTLT